MPGLLIPASLFLDFPVKVRHFHFFKTVRGGGMGTENGTIEREFIPSLREGVDIIRMVFFQKMRDFLAEKYPDREKSFYGMAGGAVMNELFATPNPEPKFVQFFKDNQDIIVYELEQISANFPDFCIALTDALRIHYLCNFQEEIDDAEPLVLARARELGVLLEDRDVPLPKEFMEFVYRIGKAHGLLN
jgi:hypothetical protein